MIGTYYQLKVIFQLHKGYKMALNSAINTGALGSGFVYSDGAGGLSASSGMKITKFTSSNTWTKDARTTSITVIAWNAGGGGGSGRQGATTAAGGGAGGSAGALLVFSGLAAFFNSTETVTIAAAPNGGIGQAAALTNGIAGTPGGVSSLGNIYTSNTLSSVTNAGRGGMTTTTTGGSNLSFYMPGSFPLASTPSTSDASGGAGSNVAASALNGSIWSTASGGLLNYTYINTQGGGGGGADAATPRSGAAGANLNSIGPVLADTTIISAGGAGGIETGTINGLNGNDKLSTTGGRYIGSTGGGGGGGQSVGLVAGNGGNAGGSGAAGGGGGGSISGTTSGSGGNGGRGELWVIEWF